MMATTFRIDLLPRVSENPQIDRYQQVYFIKLPEDFSQGTNVKAQMSPSLRQYLEARFLRSD